MNIWQVGIMFIIASLMASIIVGTCRGPGRAPLIGLATAAAVFVLGLVLALK